MLVVTTRFPQPAGKSPAEIREMFLESAPRYRVVPGLVRKHYYLAADGSCGGVYIFRRRADAERLFDAAFAQAITERFGAPPKVEYLVAPVTVDNVANSIEAQGVEC